MGAFKNDMVGGGGRVLATRTDVAGVTYLGVLLADISGPTAAGANAVVTGLGAVKQLSDGAPAPPADAFKASVQVVGATIAVTFDGTLPSSTNGFQFQPGDIVELTALEIAAAKFVQLAATATLQIYYSK